MQGRSAEFDATISKPHTAVSQCDVIVDGKVTARLPIHSGNVVADRMAAIMRSFELEVSDPDGTLAPTGMDSDLAPFGRRIQMYRGVRNSDTEFQSVLYNAANPWTVSGQSAGVFVSVKVDSNGALTLGP